MHLGNCRIIAMRCLQPAQITRQNLAPLLWLRAPISATDLAAALRVNRTTIVRALADFGDELVTMGATRSTRCRP